MPYRAPEDKRKFQKRRRVRLMTFLRTVKELTPCEDCGRRDKHYLMELDHVAKHTDRSPRSWRRVINELMRCDVVCLRCHGERTWRRATKAQ